MQLVTPGTPGQKIPSECLAQGSDPVGREERFPFAALPQEMLSDGGKERGTNADFSSLLASQPGVRGTRPTPRTAGAPLLPGGAALGRGACGVKRVHSTQTPRKNAWINYAEGFLDFFQVIKFRFLAFILVPGSTRRHGRQNSSLIVPGLKFDFVT